MFILLYKPGLTAKTALKCKVCSKIKRSSESSVEELTFQELQAFMSCEVYMDS